MFGLGTYTRILPGGVYSLETLYPEWRNNNNSSFKNKLSRLRFIATTVAALASSTENPDILVLGALKEIVPKIKRSLLGIEQFIKHPQKGGKLNGIVFKKNTQKNMFTDEVVVPNDVLRV